VFSVIVPPETPLDRIKAEKPWGVISRRPASVLDEDPRRSIRAFSRSACPFSGYATASISSRAPAGERWKGRITGIRAPVIRIDRERRAVQGDAPEQRVWMSHGDRMKRLPQDSRSSPHPKGTFPPPSRARPAHLRAPVPSRGVPHRVRLRDSQEFPLPRMRLRAELGIGLVRRAGDREDPRAGRGRPRSLRRIRRRRQLGHGVLVDRAIGKQLVPCSSTTGCCGSTSR